MQPVPFRCAKRDLNSSSAQGIRNASVLPDPVRACHNRRLTRPQIPLNRVIGSARPRNRWPMG